MVTVQVFHNVTTDEQGRPLGMLVGYQLGHEVVHVATLTLDLDTTDPQPALNQTFELLNVGDDPDFHNPPHPQAVAYRQRRNRSLSVGDVAEVAGMFYSCESAGWKERPAPTIVTRTAYGTTPLIEHGDGWATEDDQGNWHEVTGVPKGWHPTT